MTSPIHLKPCVKSSGVQAVTVLGITVAASVYEARALPLTVTSICDVASGRLHNSKHAQGLAFDLRIPSRCGAAEFADDLVRADLAAALGPEWEVVLHGLGDSRHFHVEFDPKPAAPAVA